MQEPKRQYGFNPHPGFARLTADAVLANGPVWFAGAKITSDGAGIADVTFHDGVNASGPQLYTDKVTLGESGDRFLPWPVYLERGLFVDVGSNVEEVFVLFRPAESGPPPTREAAGE